jgi:hypothetical protein
MATKGQNIQNLYEFLMDAFDAQGLKRFLVLNGYEDVTFNLTESVGLKRYAFDLV